MVCSIVPDLGVSNMGDEWRDRAICASVDPGLFFPEGPGHLQMVRDAKRICASCDVSTRCLEQAVADGEEFGIFGGTTPKERAMMMGVSWRARPKPACARGHQFTEANTYYDKFGNRRCRKCMAARDDKRKWVG